MAKSGVDPALKKQVQLLNRRVKYHKSKIKEITGGTLQIDRIPLTKLKTNRALKAYIRRTEKKLSSPATRVEFIYKPSGSARATKSYAQLKTVRKAVNNINRDINRPRAKFKKLIENELFKIGGKKTGATVQTQQSMRPRSERLLEPLSTNFINAKRIRAIAKGKKYIPFKKFKKMARQNYIKGLKNVFDGFEDTEDYQIVMEKFNNLSDEDYLKGFLSEKFYQYGYIYSYEETRKKLSQLSTYVQQEKDLFS